MTIQQLSQETGIGIDTLRIWERRYGFPVPDRDSRGHRSYSQKQVDELRIVKSLQSYGQRPGKIFSLSGQERRQLLETLVGRDRPDNQRLQQLIEEFPPSQIAQEMAKQREKLGLELFILKFAVPLLQLLDRNWAKGQLSIAREHLISDHLEDVIKPEFATLSADKPQILFLTMNGERHKLGLLLAAALFHAAGVNCIWINESLPLSEIPPLAQELGVAGVALSFSSHYSKRQAKQDLGNLRKELPTDIKLVAGGQAAQQIPSLPNLLVCTDLRKIRQLVGRHFRGQKDELI
ncbi:MerR family transcriptional regulator [Pelobacter seleniigenes]|uniref:MerR family transcriptional regulator n=1 Tax=Pelobacter seleniigenes TaxID=407188 RepID=UPI0004A7160F|nr:MerR family transcriptional regulator [Pelobacter seleniigenes]